jgi:hypothetical protein
MSAKTPDAKEVEKDVEKAFSKVEKAIEKAEKAIPQMADELSPTGIQIAFEPLTGMAAWYIDTAEEFARRSLDLQEQAARLMKNTPWGSLLQAQVDTSRQLVENSFGMARNLWRLSSPRSAHRHRRN